MVIEIACVVFAVSAGYFGYRWSTLQKSQDTRVRNLETKLTTLEETNALLTEKLTACEEQIYELRYSKVSWLDDGFNYLALGNSITSHGLATYWWNEDIGMAASCEDRDFVHVLAQLLPKAQKQKVFAYNASAWEVQAADRAETLALLDGYLSKKLNLITLQLSENAQDLTTFERDYEELIRYIREKAPNAQIVVIDDFWDNGDKAQMKKRAADKCGVDFVSLEEIKGDPEYQAGMGTIVLDKAGNEHKIDHEGVAAHPGDKGMQWIAEAVAKVVHLQLHR